MSGAPPPPAPLDPERSQELLWQALQQPEDQRQKWLAAQRLSPAERAEVASLLSHHAEADSSLFRSPVARPTESGERLLGLAAGKLPEFIGGYRVLRVIASGGMGTVYEAEQESPRRTVALKVMDRGLASPGARRRFGFEAEALALLRHPGIAQIYEAVAPGEDATGTPWFAMEHVPGAETLTDYANAEGLDLHARLSLFAEVCDAVQHGHSKGVIHRDLKPANILVNEDGRPKVIDFGVARLAHPTHGTAGETQVGQLVGTLGSMAPEQLLGSPDAIDIRADVYALGTVLYELLARRPPWVVIHKPVLEATRLVLETEPRRLTSVDAKLPLDAEVIVATAMARDRERRYASAAALADDVRRLIGGRPIAARPPSLAYLLSRFAARHRLLVGAAALVLVALVTSTVVSLRFAWEAERQANAAELARAEEAEARSAAEQDRARTEMSRLAAEQARANTALALEQTAAARDAEAEQRKLAERARAGPSATPTA